ncbi:MAG: Oxidoreductase, short chain dehydrogenase/reductase family [uncultured bacterium]|nr:MAG: Oxidoreductase, short chain dehydrogenase/reductase family [uncultured bacterium]
MLNFLDRQFKDFTQGEYVYFTKKFNKEKHFLTFSSLSEDKNALHHDVDYAKNTPYARPIVPMHLAALPLSMIAGMIFPGHRSLYLSATINSIKPIYYDEEMHYSAKIVSASEAMQTLRIRTIIYQEASIFLQAEQIIKVRDDLIPDVFLEKINNENLSHISRAKIKPKILITGASGEIGRCIAFLLAKCGYDLLLHYQKNECAIDELLEKCKNEGVQVKKYRANLIDPIERKELTDTLKNELVTHFIHAASANITDEFEALMASNYLALKELSHVLLPNMLKQQLGRIIFLGSGAMHYYPLGWDNYVAAKSAAVSYTNYLHKNYHAYDISALTISPGFVATPFSESFRTKATVSLLPEQVAEYVVNTLHGKESSSYHRLETNLQQDGFYGFYANKIKESRETEHQSINTLPECHLPPDILKTKLDQITRSFFKLDNHFDLEGVRFEQLAHWDSLKHIQFILTVERELNISFNSAAIGNIQSYHDLVNSVRP